MANHKIKAFSIMEVIIGMMLSAILVGITLAAYSVFAGAYRSYQLKNNEIGQVLSVDELLRRDFRRCNLAMIDHGGVFFRTEKDSIRYEFNEKNIIRISSVRDTFKIESDDLSASFEQAPATGIKPEQIDELEVGLFYQKQKTIFHYHKYYSSANLFGKTPNADN